MDRKIGIGMCYPAKFSQFATENYHALIWETIEPKRPFSVAMLNNWKALPQKSVSLCVWACFFCLFVCVCVSQSVTVTICPKLCYLNMGEDEARVQGCSKFKDLLGAGSSVGSLTWCSPGVLRQSRYGQTSARLRVLSQVWQIYMSLIAISRFLREGIPWSIESLESTMVCREKNIFDIAQCFSNLFQDLSNKHPFGFVWK